jgi:hypothetical protein
MRTRHVSGRVTAGCAAWLLLCLLLCLAPFAVAEMTRARQAVVECKDNLERTLVSRCSAPPCHTDTDWRGIGVLAIQHDCSYYEYPELRYQWSGTVMPQFEAKPAPGQFWRTYRAECLARKVRGKWHLEITRIYEAGATIRWEPAGCLSCGGPRLTNVRLGCQSFPARNVDAGATRRWVRPRQSVASQA